MSPSFAQLGVPDHIVRALDARGIVTPFEIQAATIRDVLDGRDVCGRAPTGSGKTLAFGVPLVARSSTAQPKQPTALVLAPTRELAEQIAVELGTFAGNVRIGVVYGGVGYGPQVAALRKGVDILVACPGRLEDLIERGDVRLDQVKRVVLDEADRMADMGFLPAVVRLLDQTRSDRQTVLFSATLDGDVATLTRDHQRDPAVHEVGEITPDVDAADHLFWKVAKPERVDVAAAAIRAEWPSIVFCRTRHGADRIAKQLRSRGVEAAAIHGGRSQNQRTRALGDFTSSRVQALVATDVAARGIHVDGVASVIHFDPPEDHKAYLHRSGRTARAGARGTVISLCTPEQRKDVMRLQRDVGIDAPITDPGISVGDRSQAGGNRSQQGGGSTRPRSERQAPATRERGPDESRSGNDDGDRSGSRPPRRKGANGGRGRSQGKGRPKNKGRQQGRGRPQGQRQGGGGGSQQRQQPKRRRRSAAQRSARR